MSKTWVFQDPKQVKKHGTDAASWCVGWYNDAGRRKSKSCGSGNAGKRLADKEAEKISAQLLTGTYEDKTRTSWADFRLEYASLVLDNMSAANRQETTSSLDHFERLINPKKIAAVSSADLLRFVSKRRKEHGMREGECVSPATINKELRHLRAVFRKAAKLGHLKTCPDIPFVKEPKKLPCWVPPDHLAKMYQACDVVTRPTDLPYPVGDWWRGMLIFCYMTGWRIGSVLALRRDDVDLDKGTAVSCHEDNKGARDQLVSLPPLVIEHLRKVPSFEPVFFPWQHGRRQLYDAFEAIQVAAKVKPARGNKGRYGFHDLRRAFATLNAGRLSADVLQALMQHRCYSTTQRYIDLARQMQPAAHDVFVPDLGGQSKASG
jgi:integrase